MLVERSMDVDGRGHLRGIRYLRDPVFSKAGERDGRRTLYHEFVLYREFKA